MKTKKCGGCGTTDLKMFTASQRNKCKDCRKLEKVKGEAENTPTNWLSKAWGFNQLIARKMFLFTF